MQSSMLRVAAVAAAVFSLAGMGGPALANPGGAPAVPLNTGQEADPVHTGANGSFTYSIEGTRLCYTLTARNLSAPATAAHIHLAPRNVAGAVVVPLAVGTGTDWTVDACTTVNAALLAAIEAHPRSYYVNVHNAVFPGGEIRGQLK